MTESIEDSCELYYNLGVVNDDLKDYKSSVYYYTKALELDPNNFEVYNNRAYSKYELNDYTGTILDFNKFIELNPEASLSTPNTNISYAYYYIAISKEFLGIPCCADFEKSCELGYKFACKRFKKCD